MPGLASASRRGQCRSKTVPGRSTRARRAAPPPRRRSRDGPPSGVRGTRSPPGSLPTASSSSCYRVADPRDDIRGEQAHVRERLLVRNAGEPAPEAQVVVRGLLIQPDQTVRDLLRSTHEVPLPGQVFFPHRLRARLLPVRPPLSVAGTLVRYCRAHDLPRPSRVLVHEGHPRRDVRESLISPAVTLQGRPYLPVRLAEGTPARGGEKPVAEARGPVYRGVGERADVDGEPALGARPERQVVEAPAPALIASAALLVGVADHIDPLLEERGPVLPFEAKRLELVLHVALPNPENEPPA